LVFRELKNHLGGTDLPIFSQEQQSTAASCFIVPDKLICQIWSESLKITFLVLRYKFFPRAVKYRSFVAPIAAAFR
jgi:hypothetical protein